MSTNIAGKVVVITGASSGLGEAAARLLSAEGASVVLGARRAERLQSEGLRQEVQPYNIRTTVISPGAVATELPSHITEREIAGNMQKFYAAFAIPADSFARAVLFAMSQPDNVDVNEILFRPTRQEL